SVLAAPGAIARRMMQIRSLPSSKFARRGRANRWTWIPAVVGIRLRTACIQAIEWRGGIDYFGATATRQPSGRQGSPWGRRECCPAVGNRLTVDPRTLTPLVLVRIQVPQPSKINDLEGMALREVRAMSHLCRIGGRQKSFALLWRGR